MIHASSQTSYQVLKVVMITAGATVILHGLAPKSPLLALLPEGTSLREAKVEVKEIPGKPGAYNAVAYLRPWLQMEELTTSMRMVARIPQKS